MNNLCFGVFVQLIVDHYVYSLSNEVLSRELFESISPSSEHSKYKKDYLKFFHEQKRNIPENLKGWVSIEPHKTDCKTYFTSVIVPSINPALEIDFYSKLENIIDNDDTIVSRKKSSLHKVLERGDKGQYLYDVFAYAITKPNKDFVTSIEPDHIALISEVDQKCPLCPSHTPFARNTASGTHWRYSITRIYPEFLDTALKSSFDAIKPKPSDPDDIVNKICLCDDCASNYLATPTTAVYDRLLRIKNRVLNNPSSSPIATQELDEKITEILDKLGSTNPTEPVIATSRMKPLKLANKIPDDYYLLIKEIRDDNDTYFWFIKDHISQMDEYRSSFRLIASQIHTSFINLDNLGYDYDRIFNDLIDWILHRVLLPNTYRQAAHIIVSFFVQNCEVFDEIS